MMQIQALTFCYTFASFSSPKIFISMDCTSGKLASISSKVFKLIFYQNWSIWDYRLNSKCYDISRKGVKKKDVLSRLTLHCMWFSFHYINCLNACATIIVPVSEIKSYGRIPSFYSKIVNQRTLHAVSLEYSIKSDMFFALRKLNLFKLDRWSLALLPTHLLYQND